MQDTYKVNWDAAIDSANNQMGVGVIVKDHPGMIIVVISHTIGFILEPMVVEEITALYVAKFRHNLGLSIIILEGESLQVVNAVQYMGHNWSRYGYIVADIQSVLQWIKSWQICHNKRAINCVAHGLAK